MYLAQWTSELFVGGKKQRTTVMSREVCQQGLQTSANDIGQMHRRYVYEQKYYSVLVFLLSLVIASKELHRRTFPGPRGALAEFRRKSYYESLRSKLSELGSTEDGSSVWWSVCGPYRYIFL